MEHKFLKIFMYFLIPMLNCISVNKSILFPEFSPEIQAIEYLKAEDELADVTELLDTNEIGQKIKDYKNRKPQTPINRLKLGILYHEAALNFTPPQSYSDLGYEQLLKLSKENNLPKEFTPFLFSYLASLRSLQGRDYGSIGYVRDAFWILDNIVEKTGEKTGISLFIRASIAENLPWFFGKNSLAREDLELILKRKKMNPHYCSDKMIKFVHQGLSKKK